MKLYHVDRSNELQENQIIQLNKVFFKSDTELCNLFDSLFPNGISRHGELYLNDFFTFPPNEYPIFCLKDDLEKMGIHVSENLLELYRRANFPEIPSRFTSMFALKNIDDLKKKLDSEWTYEIYGTISKDEMLNTYNQTMKK